MDPLFLEQQAKAPHPISSILRRVLVFMAAALMLVASFLVGTVLSAVFIRPGNL